MASPASSSSSRFPVLQLPWKLRFLHSSPRARKRKKQHLHAHALLLQRPKKERETWFDITPSLETKQNFVLRMKEVLLRQPDQVVEMADLGRMRAELGILRKGKSRKMGGLVRRFPAVFEFYKDDDNNRNWCGFTANAEQLLGEEKALLAAMEPELVQKLRKLLMMSVDHRILLDKILRVRQCLGLPYDFTKNLFHKYPEFFSVQEQCGRPYLQLNSWDSELAVSVVQRKAQQQQERSLVENVNSKCLRFPWIYKDGFMPKKKRADEIERFQSATYISPYLNSPDLQLPHESLEADKFAVGVLHEFLSLTVEKRGIVEQIVGLAKEYRFPDKIFEFLARYDGIFYVVPTETKSLLFLKEGYRKSTLIEKGPLVLWKERFVELALGCKAPPQNSKGIEKEEDAAWDSSDFDEEFEGDVGKEQQTVED